MTSFQFNSLLLDISNQLSPKQLDDMKFLCRELVGKRDLETITSGTQLFQRLTERGQLGADKTERLSGFLRDIHRQDLSEKLDNFESGAGVSDGQPDAADEEHAVAAVLFIVSLRKIEKLRSVTQRLAAFCVAMTSRAEEGPTERPLLQEYGDISRVETNGASEVGARTNGLDVTGVEASYRLAKSDLMAMDRYRKMIINVGNSLRVAPALIAAIISRQSRAGSALSVDGYGMYDRNSFGLMQINGHYHVVKGEPFSREHVDYGVTFLIQLIKTIKRAKPGWNQEQQLKGALACYVSGEGRVLPLTYDQLDSVTRLGDFTNDVVARAHWFSDHGF